jgi:hypothetical protein
MISRGLKKLLNIFHVSPKKQLEGKHEQEMLQMIEEVDANIRQVRRKIAENEATMRQRDDPKVRLSSSCSIASITRTGSIYQRK